jgi:CheY-like chemotaxis protein
MLHPEDRERVLTEQSKFDPTQTSAPIHVEYRMVRSDGQIVWIQNTAFAVRDSDGKPQFVLGLLFDVTERKHAEEELRQSLKRQAVARLAAGVAHDFNNVLGAILAYASLLRDEIDDADDERRIALDEIARAARRGYSLTRELSAIAEPEAVRPKPERAATPDRSPPIQASLLLPVTAKTILVVDDEDAIRRATAAILARRGYRVLTASSGSEALALLASEPHVDLLLSDVIMPGMGGRDLAERARASREGLKVAFISGFTDDEALRRGGSEADFALLQKPFSSAELVAYVREIIGG